MNIQFQICGLCILLMMIIFYKSHKNLHLYKETVFFAVLCIMTVSLICDITSVVAIHFRASIPTTLVHFICKTYVIMLICGVWSALIYIISDFIAPKRHKKITFRSALVVALQALIVYCLPIHVFAEGSQVYTYGPAIFTVYFFAVAYMITTLVITFIYRREINPRRKFAILVWMSIWMLSAVIQFFNNELLLVGFASSLGVLILFVVMENPEGNMERQLGCFNSYALTEYLKQKYYDCTPFSLIQLSFDSEKYLEDYDININTSMMSLLSICGNKVLVFKNVNNGLILISDSNNELESIKKRFLLEYSGSEYFQKEAFMVLVPRADIFTNSEELFQFLVFVKTKHRKEKIQCITTNKQMADQFKHQFIIEREIALALQEDRVEVFLQPIFSTREGNFTSAEALVRIRKTDGQYIPPGLFIPVAEDNGQILELGDRVFEKVCRFLKNTDALQLGIRYIEINLSVVQCEREDLHERLISITERFHIDPKYINLEITETASIMAREILLENMKKLITYGFTFSLDDFGKGQSNLMYVVDMPVSIIKLDYDMSKAYFNTQKAKQVLKAVVNMSHSMGLQVVAEGIETFQEIEQITNEGIDYIQGFYYSKPLPMEEFLSFIEKA